MRCMMPEWSLAEMVPGALEVPGPGRWGSSGDETDIKSEASSSLSLSSSDDDDEEVSNFNFFPFFLDAGWVLTTFAMRFLRQSWPMSRIKNVPSVHRTRNDRGKKNNNVLGSYRVGDWRH
jgi:hypothetical protein